VNAFASGSASTFGLPSLRKFLVTSDDCQSVVVLSDLEVATPRLSEYESRIGFCILLLDEQFILSGVQP